MKRSLFDNSRADCRGMVIASLCFVHCVAGPLLLTFAGLTSLGRVSDGIEPLFLLGSAAMGVVALVPAYLKRHGRASCLTLFGFGLVCLVLGRHIEFRAIPIEPIATALGATLIIGSHALNLRFSKHCECCDPASEEVCDEDVRSSTNPSQGRFTARLHLSKRLWSKQTNRTAN